MRVQIPPSAPYEKSPQSSWGFVYFAEQVAYQLPISHFMERNSQKKTPSNVRIVLPVAGSTNISLLGSRCTFVLQASQV